jgi:inhibitor of KinA
MQFIPLGDSAVTATGVDAPTVAGEIRKVAPPGVFDILAAFDSVTVYYDVAKLVPAEISPYDAMCSLISQAKRAAKSHSAAASIPPLEIPVRYGGEDGPDLQNLARTKKLSEQEFISLHSRAKYVVLAVGFIPGFGYLGGLPKRLHAPRLATPRTRVPAGSVAIGATYAGVYPFESPGGWNIIGRTSLELFDPRQSQPAKFRVGQIVRFRPHKDGD